MFFGITVIIPLWLETIMGYTAFLSGLTVAPIGILSLVIAPFLGRALPHLDARKIASAAFLVFALVMFMRARFDLQTDFWSIVLPPVIQGAATVSFFLPLTALLLAGLPPERIPAATGLSNFARFTAGAFGASVSVTMWNDRAALHRAHLVEQITDYNPHAQSALAAMHAHGLPAQQALGLMDQLIEQQARMLGTIDLFWLSGVLFIAMRYVPGGDVRTLLHEHGPMPPARAGAIISAVASALDAAHAIGLGHREVKPTNMLVAGRVAAWMGRADVAAEVSRELDAEGTWGRAAGAARPRSRPSDIAPGGRGSSGSPAAMQRARARFTAS